MSEWPRRHPVLWRAVALVVAGGLAAGAFVTFALGGCHDAGGFCSDEFSPTHVEAYASAAVLAALATPAAVVTWSRRVPVLAVSAAAAAAAVGAAAALLERSG